MGLAAATLVAELAGQLPAADRMLVQELLDAGERHELGLLLAAAVPPATLTREHRSALQVLAG